MCTCITEVENKTLEMLQSKYPDKHFDKELNGFEGTGMQNTMLSLGEKGGRRTYQEFKVETSFTKTNGEASKPKKETISLYHTFCPFCGKRYDGETERTFTERQLTDLQGKVYKLTGKGEVMKEFNALLGVSAG